MNWVWIVALAAAIVVGIAIAARGKRPPRRIILHQRREALFTAAERSFLGVLDQATAGRYPVFGKVRIADVLEPVKVKAVIELNDKSNTSSRRINRDELVSTACADAGLALRMVKAQRSYSVDMVRELVNAIDVELRVEPDGQQVSR